MSDVQRHADAVMAAIDEDIAAELVPAGVASFTELHDYVDANGYLEDAGVPWGADDSGTHDTVNAIADEVSRRLAARAQERSRARPLTLMERPTPGADEVLPLPVMIVSSPQVSAQMARHPRKDTGPELALRRLLFARGLRYRLQLRVPGMARRTIDIAFPGRKVAVFLDGCFWHGCPEHGMVPQSNREWWRTKLDANRRRDEETAAHLTGLGWDVLRFWCHEDLSVVADAVAARLARPAGATPTRRRDRLR